METDNNQFLIMALLAFDDQCIDWAFAAAHSSS
jgi:hypothetical protein